MNKCVFVILAGGNSTRFGRSKLKYDLCGKSVLQWVIDLTENPTIITSPTLDKDLHQYKTIIQKEARGTGDAFFLALNEIKNQHILVLMGDMPFIRTETIKLALDNIENNDLVFGKFHTATMNQYGRVIQHDNKYKVVEYAEHPEIADFYHAGWICLNKDFVETIKQIPFSKTDKEAYLTKYIELANKVKAIELDEDEALGINCFEDYIRAQKLMNRRLVDKAFMKGVDFADPDSVVMQHDTEIEAGCEIHSQVVFQGKVRVGQHSKILPFTTITNSYIGAGCTVGPYSYVHDSDLADRVHVGAFCEIKKSSLGTKTKSKHHAYIGDAELGQNVNVGAHVAFLNYDGQKKHKTSIGDEVFLGGHSAYVAPVEIGTGSYIGAGTIVREDVGENLIYCTKPNKILKCRRMK